MLQVLQTRRGCKTTSWLHLNWKRKESDLFVLITVQKKTYNQCSTSKATAFYSLSSIFAAKEGFMLIFWKHYLEFALCFIYLSRKKAQCSLGIYGIDQFCQGFWNAVKQANQVSNIYIHAYRGYKWIDQVQGSFQ